MVLGLAGLAVEVLGILGEDFGLAMEVGFLTGELNDSRDGFLVFEELS